MLEEMIRQDAVSPEKNRIRKAFGPVYGILSDAGRLQKQCFDMEVVLSINGISVKTSAAEVVHGIQKCVEELLVPNAQDEAVATFYEKVRKLPD